MVAIGIVPINVGPHALIDHAVDIARRAEAAGIESVWTFEHVCVPLDYESRYPYHKSGKMPITTDTLFLDPLITLSHIAAATTTLKLGTGVNILPQTNPLLFAKQTATLDQLSGGRLLLGLGVGWLKEEFAAMGVPFERRGARFRDYVRAIRKVWTGQPVEHHSDFLDWDGFVSLPAAKQQPGPPILVGGSTDPALKRVAAVGDGFYAPNARTTDLADMLDRLKGFCEAAGRDYAELKITATWMPALEPDALPKFAEMGVERVIVPLHGTGCADWSSAIDKLATWTA